MKVLTMNENDASMMKNLEMKNPGMKGKELKNYPAATYYPKKSLNANIQLRKH